MGATAVTVIAALALCPIKLALILALPAATPVTTPVTLIVATVGDALDHVADPLMLAVVPSLYTTVAVSCCVPPTATEAVGGVTASDTTVGAVAITVIIELATLPETVAVIVADPVATAVTRPFLTVATAGFELVHVAKVFMLAVEPSLYFPVAFNCCVAPTASGTADGLIETESRVSEGVGVGLELGDPPQLMMIDVHRTTAGRARRMRHI